MKWCWAAWAAGILAVSFGKGEMLFEENFRNYRERLPLCTDESDVWIANDPIWSRRAEAQCRMKTDGFVFRKFRPDRFAGGGNPFAFDLDFRFRFLSDRPEGFEGWLRFGTDPASDMILSLTPTGMAMRGTGRMAALRGQGTWKRSIPPNEDRRLLTRVEKGRLGIWLEDNRRWESVLSLEMPPGNLPLEGVNFFGYRGTGFALSAIQIRDPAPLPDYRITQLLPLSRPFDGLALVSGREQPVLHVEPSDRLGLVFRTGTDSEGVVLTLEWADGTTDQVAFAVGNARRDQQEFPDALLTIRGLSKDGPRQFYIRPLLRRYHSGYSLTDTYRDLVRDWNLLPKASEQPVKVELQREPGGWSLYLNGRYADRFSKEGLRGLRVVLSPGAAAGGVFSETVPFDADRFLPLDLEILGKARAFFHAHPSPPAGWATVRGIPLRVADGSSSADVGLVAEGQGNWALEVDEYLARSPFDGFLSEIHFSVPAAPYRRAWVLCALDPDPTKDNVLTVRLGRYYENGSGNNLLADSVVTLPRPGEKSSSPFLQEVGVVSVERDGAPEGTVPLYLVEVPLRSGLLLDLIAQESALNFEFLGRTGPNWQQIDNRSKPDPSKTSGVQLFGVTLERSPAAMEVILKQPGNVFCGQEKPEMGVLVKAEVPTAGVVELRAWNDRGASAGSIVSAPFHFARRGEQAKLSLPLPAPEVGWFEMVLSLKDEKGDCLIEHPARYAILPADERRAGYESPFGVWWFDGAHRTPSDPAVAGPLMLKAGIRVVGWTSRSEAELAPWKLTKDQVKMPFSFRDLAMGEERTSDPDAPERKWAAAVQRANQAMTAHLQKYPHLREVLIFHESGPGNDVPVEVLGLTPDLNEAQRIRETRYAELYNRAGEFFRANHPELRTVVGNNSCSAASLAAIFRHGGRVEYLDAIGIEAPSQTFIPEKLQEWALQGQHIARDVVRTLTGREVPVTGCYEFTYRCERDIGERQQAEWYVRDALIGLAHGFTRVGPGILFDCANAYYNTLWGASGLLQRGPYGYPKRAYVGLATLTAVLDRARVSRQLSTGSRTIYAVEFRREDGRWATALWCARGEADLALEFGHPLTVEIVDFYGRRRRVQTDGGRVRVTVSTAASYCLADSPLRAIQISARRFPQDETRARQAVALALQRSSERLHLVPDCSLDTPLRAPLQLPIRQAGLYRCEQVEDEERGVCWEIGLEGPSPLSGRYITEYAFFRLQTPVEAPGEPDAIGLWVKGNSGWGRVWFEIEDGEGEVWRSVGTGGWGCDILDWPGQVSINFDGWNFISLPLRESPLFEDRSPGPVLEQWVSDGGDKTIQYPIRLRGIGVEMTREALELREFQPVHPVIRIQDLSVVRSE